tara:strand:- start:507 stop:1958 length:1452 start_codon:yes stop_codon:yes gene_type:complete
METLQRTANRGSVSTGYDIDNSLKLEADNTEYLHKTNDAGTNRKTFTVSMWCKRSELSNDYMQLWQGGITTNVTRMGFFGAGGAQESFWVDISEGATQYRSYSNQVLRDTSAWYHVVLAVDTTQATEADRFKVWLNGEEITSWGARQYPTEDFDTSVKESNVMVWGAYDATYYKMCGYIAECHYLDGVAKVQTDFGEVDDDSGIWKPKEYTGTYGGNGCYLKFDSSGSLGADSSGNSNTFTLVNIAAADQATDTPTNNFAIANILISVGGYFVTTEGATKGLLSTADPPGNNIGGVSLVSTLLASGGKWYFEAQNTNSGDVYLYLGAGDVGDFANWGIDGERFGDAGVSLAWRGGGAQDGKVYINNSATGTGVTWETEVVGMALDLDNGVAYFHKAGTWINSGDPAAGTDNGGQYDLPTGGDGQWCMGVSGYNLATWLINFGGYTTMSISSAAADANGYGTFEYAPPSGYYALCTKNLAEFGG